ncbi:uncharacterized protein LOC129763588 [Toxorhynchites rutilus septentrionalis]|uniref:uncharacterized protein LOC129763588 n=1 Tax=Toxorhynchites rutilus septentrionalis TaxID=329112 RepID=UPI002479EB71|nr:uncharacterized protein LOC129763588 [Toxorhynchites rutilus septentrionalis]
MTVRNLLLLLVSIFCLAKFVKSYDVPEHRVDYIKLVDGHEYDYHYHDGGPAPRLGKSKSHHPHSHHSHRQQQSKRKSPSKQPYYHNKYFVTGYELIHTNDFQPTAAPIYSSFKQQNSLPTFESHEKLRRPFVEDHDYHDEDSKWLPMGTLLPKSVFPGPVRTSHGAQLPALKHTNIVSHGSYEPSSRVNEAASFVSTIPTQQTTPTIRHQPVGTSFLTNDTVPSNTPGFHYIAGGYTYFNSHPSNQAQKIIKEAYLNRPVGTYYSTTRKPYVAPSLTTPSPATAQQPVKYSPPRRPYIAPAQTTTIRPYVAPSVSQSTGQSQALSQTGTNGANRIRYTTTKAAEDTKSGDLYEPEFDIDIRIDVSPDSP